MRYREDLSAGWDVDDDDHDYPALDHFTPRRGVSVSRQPWSTHQTTAGRICTSSTRLTTTPVVGRREANVCMGLTLFRRAGIYDLYVSCDWVLPQLWVGEGKPVYAWGWYCLGVLGSTTFMSVVTGYCPSCGWGKGSQCMHGADIV